MLSLLEALVNIDTASDNKEGADILGNLLYQQFADQGFVIERNHQDYYGDHIICKLNSLGSNTLIIGHFDTALPKGSVKERPFKIVGDKAYGPGVVDMKAGIVATLFAVKSLLKTTDVKPNITIIFNSDEEPGSPTSRNVIQKEALRASRCFIMEGSSPNSIVTERKGVGIFTFKCKGVAAHAGSDPENGRSAIIEMGHKILELSALSDLKRGVSVNVGVVNGGTYPYVIAEEAVAKVDCRIPTKEDGNFLINKFSQLVKMSHVEDVITEWDGSFHRPPMEKGPGTIQLLKQVSEMGTELGLTLREKKSGGASDGNLTSAFGVPTICGMGPEGDGCHGPNEYVNIQSIFERTKLLAQALYKL